MKILFILKTKLTVVLSLVFLNNYLVAQLPIEKKQELDQVHVENDYQTKYNIQLRRVRRVYPLALKAADLVHNLDEELEKEESKRKKRKLTKIYQKELKENYVYVIKDLYIEEGKLLMKLIHRETGMTAAQLISKYKGKFRSEFYDQIGKLWDQDLDATYDPTGKDWLTEVVIKDVLSKEVSFTPEPRKMSKEEYKASMKEYRADKRAAKKLMREKRRAASEIDEKEE